MSALETLIRIRVQNDASNGLDDVAESAEEMERKVQKAMEDLRNRLRSSMQAAEAGKLLLLIPLVAILYTRKT